MVARVQCFALSNQRRFYETILALPSKDDPYVAVIDFRMSGVGRRIFTNFINSFGSPAKKIGKDHLGNRYYERLEGELTLTIYFEQGQYLFWALVLNENNLYDKLITKVPSGQSD